MGFLIDPKFGSFINAKGYAAGQSLRRNSGNTAYEWYTPGGVTGDDGSVAAIDPSTLSPVVNLDPDTISGSDGDTISTVASGGTAAAFAQATSGDRPVLKKASNGLDSHNVIRFASTDSLTAATGAADLDTDWTVIEVRKHSSLTNYQNGVSWGDASNGERRSPNFKHDTGTFAFIGHLADLASSYIVVISTWYVLATTYDSATGIISEYVDGVLVKQDEPSNPFAAYSSTAINMGVGLAGGEPFYGDHAMLLMFGAKLTDEQLTGVHTWLFERFPSLPGIDTSRPIAYFSDTTEIGASQIRQTTTSKIVVGGGPILTTSDTTLSATNYPLFSINGGLSVLGGSEEIQIANNYGGQNTLAIWNKNSGGFSAVRFRRTGNVGQEMAAFGYGRDIEPWGAATQGSCYIETSDFSTASDGNFTAFRLVQTRGSGGLVNSVRFAAEADGTMYFNDQAHYNAQARILTLKTNGTVVVGNAAIATNATDGFLYIPTCAGTPTGTPTGFTGRGPLVIDSTNHKLYFYSGGAWRDAGP